MKYIYLLSLLLLLISCNNTTYSSKDIAKYTLQSEDLDIEEHIGRAYAMEAMSNFLIVRDDQIDTKLTLLNLDDLSSSVQTGYTGQGPGELINPGPIIIEDDKFRIYDGSKMQLFSFYLDSINQVDYKPTEFISIKETAIIDIKKIDDNTYIAVGVFPDNRFYLINKQGETFCQLGDYPLELPKDSPPHIRAMACQSMLATNTETSTVAVATRYGELIQFYHIDSKKCSINMIGKHETFLPEFTSGDINGTPNFRPTEKTRWGYISVTSDHDHVYALYSGKHQLPANRFFEGNIIHVFDWNGKLIKELILDKDVLSTTYCKGYLYSLHEGGSGYGIAKFKL